MEVRSSEVVEISLTSGNALKFPAMPAKCCLREVVLLGAAADHEPDERRRVAGGLVRRGGGGGAEVFPRTGAWEAWSGCRGRAFAPCEMLKVQKLEKELILAKA